MTMSGLMRIGGVARAYVWGSPTAIPALLDVEPTGEPLAELWFGAHPDAPSPRADDAEGDAALDALIAQDPAGLLGPDVAKRFDSRLPFLLKLLAAAAPLSIQVHPTQAQARAGFAAEDARGIPRDSPDRNYRDPWAKPELLYALTPFQALCGFRPIAGTQRLLELLDLPGLASIQAQLDAPDGLRVAFTTLLELPDPQPLVASVAGRARMMYGATGSAEFDDALRAVDVCAAAFPGDVGVVLSLLLNAITLAPGESIYLAAGNVHAYLGGLGVEVMASSDNVLRCGLTPKHVDVAELLAITDFRPLEQPRCEPSHTFGSSVELDVPVPDFRLTVLDLADYKGAAAYGLPGPKIVLGLDGEVFIGPHRLSLRPGQAIFGAADDAALRLSGTGRVAIASVGQQT